MPKCTAVLECVDDPNTAKLAGASNQGDTPAQPHTRETLQHLPPPMLLAHLEKKERQGIWIGQNIIDGNVGGM